MYDPQSKHGQIDVITTPFYHPILPLIYDNSVARISQPNDALPERFHYPQDAHFHVAKAVQYFKEIFGQKPVGMWPAEGAVAQDIVSVFTRNSIQWLATDEKILARSKPPSQEKFYPYRVEGQSGGSESLAIVFRDTELSDKIGFTYQHLSGKDAAEDFIKTILRYVPSANEPDRLLTVILDGENAWEWYRYDNDGKEFLHSLYEKLTELYHDSNVVTVTMSEYIHGNPKRYIAPHPTRAMKPLEWLYPGSWINANFETWIAHPEKNLAWEYLLLARQDLERSGLPQPDPSAKIPADGTKEWYAYKAWEEIYAAEGSDWFWWYGTTYQRNGMNPFDAVFIKHLHHMYTFARHAGASMPTRKFESISKSDDQMMKVHYGTMVQSSKP